MKKIFFSAMILLAMGASAQEAASSDIKPAAKGVLYGETITADGTPVKANELGAKLNNGVFDGKVTGKVTEVCKAMGCWIKLEKADGTALMVKTKDHAFFLPQDLVGKTVVVEGSASVKEVSEEKRKHFAEDAGKSKEEIRKIKGPEQQVQFVAKGIQVLD
jgi:hypothetical protein